LIAYIFLAFIPEAAQITVVQSASREIIRVSDAP
jgi:hypothetical protein